MLLLLHHAAAAVQGRLWFEEWVGVIIHPVQTIGKRGNGMECGGVGWRQMNE